MNLSFLFSPLPPLPLSPPYLDDEVMRIFSVHSAAYGVGCAEHLADLHHSK